MSLDRKTWARNISALDRDIEKQRERERKSRERSARNAQRKIERLRRELSDAGKLNEFEEEFAESVGERIDRYGSAFANRSLGRPGDVLSAAQKRVVAAMKKKAKDAKKAAENASEQVAVNAAERSPRAFRPRVVK